MSREQLMATDAELLQKYRSTNDAAAFNELARRYQQMVYAAAQRVTGDRHDAEDVAQACFLELARQQVPIQSVAGFLHRTATHRARNLIRDQSRRRHYEEQASSERKGREVDAPVAAEWDQLVPEVDDAIEGLPEKYRTPLILFYLRGLNDLEVAQEVGISRSTVARRLEVGVRMLRSVLTKAGISLSVGLLAVVLKSSTAQAAPSSLTANLGRMALIGRLSQGSPVGSTGGTPLFTKLVSFRTMMVAAPLVLLLVAVGLFVWPGNHQRNAAWPWSVSESAYDRISHHYRDRMPSGFSSRTASMARDRSLFWRGAQPLFYEWCQTHAPDWLADADAYVFSHASPMPSDAATLPYAVDVANSARLPFQIELLQAMVAFRAERGDLEDPARLIADRELFEAYRNGLTRGLDPRESIRPAVFGKEEFERFVGPDGRFRPIVYSRAGNVADVLEPVSDTRRFARALHDALRHNARFASLFSGHDPAWIAGRLKGVSRRLHVNAVTSQGLTSYVLLLRSPLAGRDGDVILEFRETVPSAAEMAGAVPSDPRTPAARAASDLQHLAPMGLAASWCEIDGRSMLVSIHDAPARPTDGSGMSPSVWGRATASTHRNHPAAGSIADRLTPELLEELSARADVYAERLAEEWTDFKNDARCQEDSRVTQQHLAELISNANKLAKTTQGIFHAP